MSDVDPFLQQATDALGRGDLDAGEASFRAGLEVAPTDPRLLGGLAVVALQRGDVGGAIEHGRAAAESPEASVEVHYNLAWALQQSGQADEATQAYAAAYVADPTRPEPIGQLMRLGHVPHGPGEEPGDPVPLETLDRLELYQHLAERGPGDSFEGAWSWAMERGAPWGGVVAWLMQQGARNDVEILQRLTARDEHLAASVVAGIIIGPPSSVQKALEEAPGVRTIGMDDPVPALPDPASDPDADFLVVRVGGDRAQIPSQRTHAGLLFNLFVSLLHSFGADSSVVLTVDPAAHVGPRRVWLLTPVSEAEVVADWEGTDADDRQLDSKMLPGSTPVPAGAMPLQLPGVDAASLNAVIEDSGLADVVGVDPEGGLVFDADRVGAKAVAWEGLLRRLSRWVPAGQATLTLWREGGTEKLAVLHRDGGPDLFTLEQVWPKDQTELDLPASIETQLLARALFEAPRSGKLYGA